MPIYNSRDLIPFVNKLEEDLIRYQEELETWSQSRGNIMNSIGNIPSLTNIATSALVKADEALSELGTATFGIIAGRGMRLKTLLDNLKEEMIEIAKNVDGNGSGKGYDPRINAEINNAVSEVDGIIEDGLKLDYRLRQITKQAAKGEELSLKDFIIPTIVEITEPTVKEFQLEPIEGAEFVEGEVTVLNENKEPVMHPVGEIVHGTISEEGVVNLNYLPLESVKLYFPVRMALKDVPEEVLYYLMDSFNRKGEQYLADILELKDNQQKILSDIQAMKGNNWTVDFSIMKNHQAIVEEAITPKGLHTEIIDGMAHLTFSHNDHPYLSHFEIERWDEKENKFIPYDEEQGVVHK